MASTLKAKEFTTAELKAIDDEPGNIAGNTGASQEPGWYWYEDDEEFGIETGPCGPFPSEAAALADAKQNWSAE